MCLSAFQLVASARGDVCKPSELSSALSFFLYVLNFALDPFVERRQLTTPRQTRGQTSTGRWHPAGARLGVPRRRRARPCRSLG